MMETFRKILSIALFSSALFGIVILIRDKWLWSSAPSHAYGLLVFTVADMIIAFAAMVRVSFSAPMASSVALVQLAAMVSDLVAGTPAGVSSIAFRDYLLGDPSFIVLMGVQVSILSVVIATVLARLSHQHPRRLAFLHRKSSL